MRGSALRVHGRGRQAVTHNDGNIGFGGRPFLQQRSAAGRQPPAEVRPPQVGVPARSPAFDRQGLEPQGRDPGQDHLVVHRGMHGVARLCMGEPELQDLARGKTGSGAAEGQSRRREVGEVRPGITGDGCGWHGIRRRGHAASALIGDASRGCVPLWLFSRPSGPAMPIRSSQAANSGARFRPSVSRR